ncbi:MAG: hypothetical protein QMD85_04085, partial [Candidatus Aenigmarchaeota archaeon]|nr:hypothetical protein [Candidatus Aenigmarchaeota archaeon]MDI6722742.1 hypothetical protein [Candidatus Aenigmarchaeota archaeon]
FFNSIGYAYCPKRERYSRLAMEYLRHKIWTIKLQKEKAEKIIEYMNCGESLRGLSRKFDCSIDFVINQKRGKPIHLPRNFPTFNDWINEFSIYNSPLVWNEITHIEDIKLNNVMDITCMKNHNFVANGIISHNCNYSGRIISPIQSRCAVFRFSVLPKDDMKSYLKMISEKEKMKADSESLDAVIKASEGDMRRAINTIQLLSSEKKITPDIVYSVISQADPEDISKMLVLALNGNFKQSREILIKLLYEKGLSGEDIIKEIHSQIFLLDVEDRKKLLLLERLGEYEFRLTEGSNPRIQIEAFLAQLGILQ